MAAMSRPAQDYYKEFKRRLMEHFPHFGAEEAIYAYGNILNPAYRGTSITVCVGDNGEQKQEYIQELIYNHESHRNFQLIQIALQAETTVGSDETCDDPMLGACALAETAPTEAIVKRSPIEEEWFLYLAIPKQGYKETSERNKNILGWWQGK